MFSGNFAALREALMRARSQAEAQSGAARGAVEHVASGLADLGRGLPHSGGGWQLPSRSGPEGPAPQVMPVAKPVAAEASPVAKPVPDLGGWGGIRQMLQQAQMRQAGGGRHAELNPQASNVRNAMQRGLFRR